MARTRSSYTKGKGSAFRHTVYGFEPAHKSTPMYEDAEQGPASQNTPHQPRAKKSLGQNFLKDANISARIAAQLRTTEEDWVIEIGPGPGALTKHIYASHPARLFLLEKDHHWAAEHRRKPVGHEPRPDVVLTDALLFPWHKLTADRPWKVIGNLPYNVASPLMWEIFSRAHGVRRASFMIQKEVGERLVAKAGTKQYGALSVWTQAFMQPEWCFVVPPHVFTPQPKVDSAVVAFTPLANRPDAQSAEALSWVLHTCFQQRRKQLQGILRPHTQDAAALLTSLGIDPAARPETVDPQTFIKLGLALRGKTAQ